MATSKTSSLLILGASGDLAARLLMPGLAGLLAHEPDRRVQLIGAGVEDLTDAQWKARVKESFASVKAKGPAVQATLRSTKYIKADVTAKDDLQKLVDACTSDPAIYFALPPAITELACGQLQKMELPPATSLALEKPFGTDERSAKKLNTLLLKIVPENRIHRVDHFLGRSTVLNLLGLRFANRLIEPMLSNRDVENIEIVYDEQLGLENRARYYDHAGALVDMIQSHLLQVLAVLVMEAPATLSAQDVRDQKQLALRAMRIWDDDPASSRRARYTGGTINGRKLPAYVKEDGVDPSLGTETLAEVVVEVRNMRWAGVPIMLRSGKALGDYRREIVVTFKAPTHVPPEFHTLKEPDRLRILIDPDEMFLELNVNGPGDPLVIDRAALEAVFNPGDLPAYGEVLQGILDGDAALSVRGDAAVEGWRIVAPVLAAWRKNEVPLDDYRAGSAGPASWPKGLAEAAPAQKR
ncbi:glucose-6-phosphate dehydrogenase [Frondihabitans australicus]|uniref:Glucose-6-phosphate 1-dehydrogenase n=1 Tax=Frondihabitans australicus TaxID=386892 RepID=A0A495ICH7_9MICO|nr:glucose-6-phosphate dehydrogenase [Frondihabitans australicus]RKR73001.1 glucose-6-phosphate 1-dehydrogenase [Frondihabitans australicus]